jgi:hypothetical protein
MAAKSDFKYGGEREGVVRSATGPERSGEREAVGVLPDRTTAERRPVRAIVKVALMGSRDSSVGGGGDTSEGSPACSCTSSNIPLVTGTPLIALLILANSALLRLLGWNTMTA